MRFLFSKFLLLAIATFFVLGGFNQGRCAEPTPEEQRLMIKVDNENRLAIAIFYDFHKKNKSETILYSMLTACGYDEEAMAFDLSVPEVYKFAFSHEQLRPYLNNKDFSYEVASKTALMFVFYKNGEIDTYKLLANKDGDFCPGVLESVKK